MDFVSTEAEVGGGSGLARVVDTNARKVVAKLRDFPPFLRRIVFIGQPDLGTGFDHRRISLSSDLRNQPRLAGDGRGPANARSGADAATPRSGLTIGLPVIRNTPQRVAVRGVFAPGARFPPMPFYVAHPVSNPSRPEVVRGNWPRLSFWAWSRQTRNPRDNPHEDSR